MPPIPQNIKAAERRFIERVKEWHVNPNLWVLDTFGDKIKLSNQQSGALTELGKIIQAKIKLSQGKKLTEQEQFYGEKIGLDISSGMGTGKDFFASLCMFFFLSAFPEEHGQSPHVLATANTSKQLSNVLWRQACAIPALSKALDPNKPNSKTFLDDLFVCQAEKIYRRERGGKTYFAEAVTVSPYASSDEQARALTGRHAPYMLMILDEAAGLPEAVFTNLEGTLSGRVNLILMIYNPIKARGYAVEARNNSRWLHINWNSEDTHFDNPSLDNPLQARNKDLLERYGRDSNAYRIRALGLPPIEDKDVFIPWDWVQSAINRELTPDKDDLIVMGVDPAAGGDHSVIVVRHGRKIVHIARFNEPDTMKFADLVVRAYYQWEPDSINIDPIGVGVGVYDRLNRSKDIRPILEAIDVRRYARNRQRFQFVRDELWWTLRDQFEKGMISIPNDQELIDQLGSIRIKDYAADGLMKVPTKAQMKRKESIGYSPDEADAICLTYAIPDELICKRGQLIDDEWDESDAPFQRDAITGY